MYIGKTWVSLKERLRLHIMGAKLNKKPTRKEKWILELINNSLKPLIELIEICDREIWRDREVYWITKYKNDGNPILNLKKGGDGYDNLTHSEEHKRKLSERMKGNKYGIGHPWTEEQRKLMMESRKNPWNKGTKGLPQLKHSEEFKEKISNRMSGENHPLYKISNLELTKLIDRYKNGEKIIDLAKDTSVTYSHLRKILKNKTKRILCVL